VITLFKNQPTIVKLKSSKWLPQTALSEQQLQNDTFRVIIFVMGEALQKMTPAISLSSFSIRRFAIPLKGFAIALATPLQRHYTFKRAPHNPTTLANNPHAKTLNTSQLTAAQTINWVGLKFCAYLNQPYPKLG
jgi:hypothetical protein